MMYSLILVGLGGGLGSIARFACQQYFATNVPGDFPWGTFVVNVTGCLIIGMLWGFFLKQPSLPTYWKHFFMAGICGGFTTFSAFSLESIQLLTNQKLILFSLYIAASVIAGLAATFIGIKFFHS